MISVIVPVKGEGPEVAGALSRFSRPPEVELLVADGEDGGDDEAGLPQGAVGGAALASVGR